MSPLDFFFVFLLCVVVDKNISYGCPSPCSCDSGNVQCSNRNISLVPTQVPLNTTRLYLDHNLITHLPALSFQNLTNLTTLSVRYNLLVSIEASAFDGLLNLVFLYLDNNILPSVPELAFAQLLRLQFLYLGNNALSAVPKAINSLQKAISIDLSYNAISIVGAQSFGNLTSLQSLGLTSNLLASLENITNIPSLLTLSLNRNRITFLSEFILSGCTLLSALDLSKNQISSFQTNTFSSLPNLVEKNLMMERNVISCMQYLPLRSCGCASGKFHNVTVAYNESVHVGSLSCLSSPTSSRVLLYAASSAGGAVFLLIIAIFVILYMKRRKHSSSSSSAAHNKGYEENDHLLAHQNTRSSSL